MDPIETDQGKAPRAFQRLISFFRKERFFWDWTWSWRVTWRSLKSRPWIYGGGLVLFALLPTFLFLFPNDVEILTEKVKASSNGNTRKIAQEIGAWGSLAQYNIIIVVTLWWIGKFRKSRFLQRLAMTTMVATILAGALCNVFRFTLGSPRPFTGEPRMEFRGPQASPHYHGFPSGHVSTAFGTAVPVLIAFPEVGIPITLFAGSMAWARMYDRQHYPSDVWVGTWLGILAGVAAGLPLFRLRRRLVRSGRFRIR